MQIAEVLDSLAPKNAVRDAPGVAFAMKSSGSAGTPGAAAKARGVQSECAPNRWAAASDRILGATEKTLALLEHTAASRKRQFLSQTRRNQRAAYSDLTAQDAKAAPDMQMVVFIFDRVKPTWNWWSTRWPRRHAQD